MSTVTSSYILSNEQIRELRKLAEQIPKPQKKPKGAYMIPVAVSSTEQEASDEPFKPFWEYISKNAECKSTNFFWHGIIMDRALLYLREKGIDLTRTQLFEGNDELAYLYFDKKTKDKFHEKLEPSNIDRGDLSKWLDEYHWGTSPEGVIASIQHLYDCLQLIDDNHVLLLNTDYIADVINSVPLKEMKDGVIKEKSIHYLCDLCGQILTNNWEAVKRISDIPAGSKHICGDQFLISTMLIDGKEVEKTFDSTYRFKGACKKQATGCYRTAM